MNKYLCKKEKGAGLPMIFTMVFMVVAVLAVIISVMATYARLMTHQQEIDDTLGTAALGSMIVDKQFMSTEGAANQTNGNAYVKFDSPDACYARYKDVVYTTVNDYGGKTPFYHNFKFDRFIVYQVDPRKHIVYVTDYNVAGAKTEVTQKLGECKAPNGKIVRKSSVYGKVSFDVKTAMRNSATYHKTRSIYCTSQVTPYVPDDAH